VHRAVYALPKSPHLGHNELRFPLKTFEREDERSVTLRHGRVEAVVRCQFPGSLPDAFGGVEFGRVRWKAMQLDLVAIACEPCFPGIIKPVARPVVHHKEDLLRSVVFDQLLQKEVERVTIEDLSELIDKLPVLDRYGAEYMCGLPQSIGRHPELNPDRRPGLMERAVQPEARLVLENELSTALRDFFSIAGNRTSHHCC